MPDEKPYRCPVCSATDYLRVTATTVVHLDQADPTNVQTEALDADHEWDGNSPMYCAACSHRGVAEDFDALLQMADADPNGPHLKFEYRLDLADNLGSGGVDPTAVAMLPLAMVERRGLDAAFRRVTGRDPSLIVDADVDTLFDRDGDPWTPLS